MRGVCRHCGKEINQDVFIGPRPVHMDNNLVYCSPSLTSFDCRVAEFKTKEDLVKDFLKQCSR